jgi:hypothetical protein
MLEDGRRSLAAVVTEAALPSSTPFVISCSAGRDRTGIVVACLLDLLDVTDDAIAGDYALSDEFDPGERASARRHDARTARAGASPVRLHPADARSSRRDRKRGRRASSRTLGRATESFRPPPTSQPEPSGVRSRPPGARESSRRFASDPRGRELGDEPASAPKPSSDPEAHAYPGLALADLTSAHASRFADWYKGKQRPRGSRYVTPNELDVARCVEQAKGDGTEADTPTTIGNGFESDELVGPTGHDAFRPKSRAAAVRREPT